MIQIKYTIRPFIKPNGQVAVRVRWNNNTSEVTFITGVYAEREKWDEDGHRAIKNTTHKFGKREYRSYEINDRISDIREAIDEVQADNRSLPAPIIPHNSIQQGRIRFK